MTTARNLASFGNIVGGLVGELKMWPTGTAPTGYLLCNGALVSRTTYAALFAVVGTTYGAGDGSTTFTLPNFKDRMPIGAGNTYSANTTGGSTDAIVVSHTHTATSVVTDPGHAHSFATGDNGSSGEPLKNGNNDSSYTTNSAVTGITVATTNTATGVSGTNANLPPYFADYEIIKA